MPISLGNGVSILQSAASIEGGGPETTLAVTFPSDTQAGSTIVVVSMHAVTPSAVSSVVDGGGLNTFGLDFARSDASVGLARITVATATNCAALVGSTNRTITVTLSGSETAYFIVQIFEMSGMTSFAIDSGKGTGNDQAAAATTTDAITSTASGTTTQALELVIGAMVDYAGSGETISAGTGYTLGQAATRDVNNGNYLCVEFKTVNATGTQTATFSHTPTASGTSTIVVPYKFSAPSTTPDTLIVPVQGRPYTSRLTEFQSRSRAQHSLWFAPQDVTFNPPVIDSFVQFSTDGRSVKEAQRLFARNAVNANLLLWLTQSSQTIPPSIGDTYQPPVQTAAFWESVELQKNRAIFVEFLNWNGGGDTIPLPAQHTYTQPIQISPRFDLKDFANKLRTAKLHLFHIDTTLSTVATQGDTYQPDIQGLNAVRRGQALYANKAITANKALWMTPEDVSILPPPPDTYIQPIQGITNIREVVKNYYRTSRMLNELSWQRARDEQFVGVQPTTFTQEIAGQRNLELLRRLGYRTSAQLNKYLWEQYPYLSVPPPTPAPTGLTLTPQVGSLLLTWNPVISAVMYNIYRGLSQGHEIFYTTSMVNGYVDIAVTKGITYFYYVTAVLVLESPASNEVWGVVIPGTSVEVPPTAIDRDRRHQEWYVCDRCGWYYPREKMINQNGLNLCSGDDTHNCTDQPGSGAANLYIDVPYEERPEPLPNEDIDL